MGLRFRIEHTCYNLREIQEGIALIESLRNESHSEVFTNFED